MEALKKEAYIRRIENYPSIKDFLKGKRIEGIEKLDSLWRAENLLLKIKCRRASYVLKQINGEEKETEISKMKVMTATYPLLFPEVFIFEEGAYLMEFVDGCSFFNLDPKEKVKRVNKAGRAINKEYLKGQFLKKNIKEPVQNSFRRYREKRKRFFHDRELRLESSAFDLFTKVSCRPSHNDLNAANLLYTYNGIRLIDPSEEGFNDTARDIGRYCASCFFNNYDYFGNDKNQSLDIAYSFLSNFNDEELERAKYFMGESFLSFLGFDTVSVPKEVLKQLAMNLLLKRGKIIPLLEASLK